MATNAAHSADNYQLPLFGAHRCQPGFGKALDLDWGIFSALREDQMYATGSLSTHMAVLFKIQSEMIERHRQIIQKGGKVHTSDAETSKYTVFETGTYVLLEPATGKPKDRLHSRKLGPF